jgi:hypothetical protein
MLLSDVLESLGHSVEYEADEHPLTGGDVGVDDVADMGDGEGTGRRVQRHVVLALRNYFWAELYQYPHRASVPPGKTSW